MDMHLHQQIKTSNSNLFMDKKAWVFEQMNQVNITKKIFGAFELTGDVNVVLLEKSLKELCRQSEYCDQKEIDLLDDRGFNKCFSFEYETHESPYQKTIDGILDKEADYDFSSTCLFRYKLLKIENRKFILAVNVHPKINESFTSLILLKEIMHFYTQSMNDEVCSDPIVAVQY